MTRRLADPPRFLRARLRRLLPGPIGEDACHDLDAEYAARRALRGARRADLWYAGLLLRPATWSLALAVRRTMKRRGRASAGARRGGLGISWLDVKLGLRMLAKYPVMTAVSGLAIAVTIAVAIGTFSFFQDFLLRPTVPLSEGERIVSLGLRTTDTNRTDRRLLHEFFAWREGLEGVQELSLWRTEARNIVSADGRAEVRSFTLMSASGFGVARVPPLLGRPLIESDEAPGVPPVVVIGYDEWLSRFGGDPEIVGRPMQIDRVAHTIVGVMPEGFAFPYAQRLWLPLTDDPDDYPLGDGPRYFAFGRLAPGVTLAQARAEIEALTARRAELFPDTHAHLRGQVMSYTDTHTGMDDTPDDEMMFVRVVLGILTLVVLIPFANVAILVYARTATRAGEIAVRSALGASRRRVVTQLFAEALVLASLSAAAGVGLALFALGRIESFMDAYFASGMPFWAKSGNDPWVIAYGVGLTVLAAVVAGVVPGLQATGRGLGASLKRGSGGSGLRLGKAWTSLVVAQVAITVAFLPLAGWVAWQAVATRATRATFAADEYLGAAIAGVAPRASGDVAAWPSPAAAIDEVARRLAADPRVEGVSFASRPPSALFSRGWSDFARIDVDGVEPPEEEPNHAVGSMAVEPGFFGFLGVPVVRGREFVPADVMADPPPVLVSEAFVERVLGGGNAIGRYVREYRPDDQEPAPWQEIVGVVGELVESPLRRETPEARMFTPFDRSAITDANIVVHARSSTDEVRAELQRMLVAVDPALRLGWAESLSSPPDPMRSVMTGLAVGIGAVLLSVLLLCVAGVFALVSFNVTQRQREIGIRTALGASPQRVLVAVLARSARQLAIGVAVGFAVVAATPPFNLDGLPIERDARLLVVVAVVMVVVGLLAAAGPTRRALRIQPTDALREA